jgi:hypothetical protein
VSVDGLIQQACEAGIAVAVDGGKLVVRGPRSAKELAALLWQHKAEVMAALANAATPTEPVIPAAVTLRLSPNDAPRAWADAFARLHPERPPPEVSYRQWRQFVDDCGLFIDRWAMRARDLRWSPEHLFGWETCRPFPLAAMHIGLGWRIDGGTVVALTANAATVIRANGPRLTLERRA